MAKKKETQPEEIQDNNEKQNKIEIEITSNSALLQILSDKNKVLRIMGALFVLVFVIFIALAFVTITIKSIYPYNDIKVNLYGATTVQTEEKEVIYWLFNTAELWANTGIKVEAGDKISIKASGKKHTAIHHLVDDAKNNQKLRDEWVGTMGEWNKEKNISKRDELRRKYRIFPNRSMETLLMQVIPEEVIDNGQKYYLRPIEQFEEKGKLVLYNKKDGSYWERGENEIPDVDFEKYNSAENYYVIGSEKTDILIRNSGFLHFAVNDIILTERIIKQMQNEDDSLKIHDKNYKYHKGFDFGKYPYEVNGRDTLTELDYYLDYMTADTAKATTIEQKKEIKKKYEKYKDKEDRVYHNAWFDDNVGSFLIVIERIRKK